MPKRSHNFSEEYSQHKRSQAQAIGARIGQRRKQLKLTQEDLRMRMKDENIHVTRSQFSRIENGKFYPMQAT
jgi:transcriptional regulator with XRE-family HTH domain